jgi:hypothetical protein
LFLPLEMEAFIGNTSPYSSSGEGDEFSEGGDENVAWSQRQLYINPQSLNIRDQKLVQKQLTKGGHVVQYWGEDLTTIDVQGITGSAGVEGINILRDIYRHEQLQYRVILANRQRALALAAKHAAAEAEAQMYEANVGGILLGAADALTGGAVSKTVKGLSNAVDILFSDNENKGPSSFSSAPTLAAFATNIDMYYQGEFFRGYFQSFGVTESAQEPGHFSYTFNFVVTRRSGKRSNFMPWHRNPVDFDGESLMSQGPTQGKGSWPGVERLSWPTDKERWADHIDGAILDENNDIGLPGVDSSKFTELSAEQPELPEPNEQGVSRKEKISGKS